ncbi:MAG: hypothetical protein ACOZE7_18955 [Pseudomonadota bacterium]
MRKQVDPNQMSVDGDPAPLWSQEEAIAYECAREYLSDVMGLYSQQLDGEEARCDPKADHMDWLRAEIARLGELRRQLRVKDHKEVAEIRAVYGALWQRLVGK